ncbi:uncharacterized protein LOC122814448, partial [Protopterus annectens]|uniref:uncharacterized protein LOC122814448 n=1 Tax=Protopterus annectens TaxID=7888 RepID=UPI001CFB812A
NECSKCFRERRALVIHERIHTGERPYKCSECSKSFTTTSSLRLHLLVHKETKPYKCPECNKYFRQRRNLIIHERTHVVEKPYKCTECSKGFTTTSSLRRHLLAHKEEKQYKCPECNKCFRQRWILVIHERTHTGERPYKCPECNKCFKQRGNLIIHERTHTRERPYKCPECTKNFATTSNLRVHLLVHKEEKPYKCPECNKCFRQRGTLVIHERTHTRERPYKCPECTKNFTTTSNLRVHLLVHKEKKPYKCPECNRCFSQRGNLVIHERTHMVEKPYKCAYCSKDFTTTSSLRLHLLVHKEKNCINVLNATSVTDKGGLYCCSDDVLGCLVAKVKSEHAVNLEKYIAEEFVKLHQFLHDKEQKLIQQLKSKVSEVQREIEENLECIKTGITEIHSAVSDTNFEIKTEVEVLEVLEERNDDTDDLTSTEESVSGDTSEHGKHKPNGVLSISIKMDNLENIMENMKKESKKQIEDLKEIISKHSEQITGLEESVNELDGRQMENDNQINTLLNQNNALIEKMEDLESRSGRNNIRIYGVPEKSEGNNMVMFLNNWLPKTSKKADIKAQLLFPARIKITLPDGQKVFNNIEDVTDFVRKHKLLDKIEDMDLSLPSLKRQANNGKATLKDKNTKKLKGKADTDLTTDTRNFTLKRSSTFIPPSNPVIYLFEMLCETQIRKVWKETHLTEDNLTTAERYCLRELSMSSDLRIMKPDKGGGVVIMSNVDYQHKMICMLSDDTTYIPVSRYDMIKAYTKIDWLLYGLLTEGTLDELKEFVTYLESTTTFLKFTYNISNEECEYLDIKLRKTKENIESNIYRKKTFSNSYLHFKSCHPYFQKYNLVKGQMVRLSRIISEDEEFFQQLDILSNMFLDRGYPNNILDQIKKEVGEKIFINFKPILKYGICKNKLENEKKGQNLSCALVLPYTSNIKTMSDGIKETWKNLFNNQTEIMKCLGDEAKIVFSREYLKIVLKKEMLIEHAVNLEKYIAEEFVKLHQFLHDKEQKLIQQLNSKASEILREMEENLECIKTDITEIHSAAVYDTNFEIKTEVEVLEVLEERNDDTDDLTTTEESVSGDTSEHGRHKANGVLSKRAVNLEKYIAEEFVKLHQFLHDKEQKLIQQLNSKASEILREIEENLECIKTGITEIHSAAVYDTNFEIKTEVEVLEETNDDTDDLTTTEESVSGDTSEHGKHKANGVLSAPESFEDVAVTFSAEEMKMLTKQDKELHKEVMLENYETLVSVGYKIPPEALLVLLKEDNPELAVNDKEGIKRTEQKNNFKEKPDSNGSREWSISWSQQPSLGVSVSRYPTANLQHSVQTLKGSDKHPVIPVAQLHPGYTCNMNSEWDPCSILQQSPLVCRGANKEKKPYKCPECNKCFRQRRNLVIHERTHMVEKPYKCAECSKGFRQRGNLVIHERIHTGVRPYKCPECSKCFKQFSHLTAHKRSHIERTYKCPECTKGFTRTSNLRVHLLVHKENKVYKCPECNKCYKQRGNLVIHKRTHMVEKPYKCAECSKGFTTTSSLRLHLLVHKEEKPYKCPECNKCFRQRGTLVVHERTHTRERPYKCPECTKDFTTNGNLRVHLLVHKENKPYKCPECNKCFRQRGSLVIHERIHTGERPYKCLECNKCFRQRGNLVIHERTHMVEKPYKCAECSKGFTTTRSLRRHLLLHKEKTYKCPECNVFQTKRDSSNT